MPPLRSFFLFGRRPKDRSFPACDRGRHIPAPGREGRRVGAGAPTQEPVSSGIPYPVSLMKFVLFIVYVSFWYAALFLHKLLLQVYASFTLLILVMLVWDKSACNISCFWYLMLSNCVQTNPSPTEFWRRGFLQRSKRRIWTHSGLLAQTTSSLAVPRLFVTVPATGLQERCLPVAKGAQ